MINSKADSSEGRAPAYDRRIDDDEKRLLGRNVWFKTRTVGYGWSPASWEGWAVTVVWGAASGGGILWLLRHDPAWIVPWVFVWIIGLLLVILATD